MNIGNKKTEDEQCTIPSVMLSCGWTDKITTKKYGSCADIYVEHIDDIGSKNFMLIDDGNVDVKNTVYHIYASEGLKDKIFEGYIETVDEFKVIMKVLGYNN